MYVYRGGSLENFVEQSVEEWRKRIVNVKEKIRNEGHGLSSKIEDFIFRGYKFTDRDLLEMKNFFDFHGPLLGQYIPVISVDNRLFEDEYNVAITELNENLDECIDRKIGYYQNCLDKTSKKSDKARKRMALTSFSVGMFGLYLLSGPPSPLTYLGAFIVLGSMVGSLKPIFFNAHEKQRKNYEEKLEDYILFESLVQIR